ncbi:unnamed protein product [Gordionus sp. m RMFG-2023]|uniref:cytochrome P450 10-like n=1 Tax=Gordionus sp. m RMFG-2023 TaxID=3053472 RepID=UPI0030DE2E11
MKHLEGYILKFYNLLLRKDFKNLPIDGRNYLYNDKVYSSSIILPDSNLTLKEKSKINEVDEKKIITKAIKTFDMIPGPQGWPLIGTLFDYIKKNGYGFDNMFKAQYDRSLEFGTIYKEKIGPEVLVVITDPKEYSKVVRTDSKYPNRMALEPMIHYRRIRNLPIGLFNAVGEDWHKYRKVLNSKMLDMKEANNYLPRLNEVSTDFVQRLKIVSRLDNFCIEKELFKWAMESIGVLLFDSRLNCFQDPMPIKTTHFIESVAGYTRTLQSLITDFPWYKYYKTKLWKENEKYADVIFKTGEDLVEEKVLEYEKNNTLQNTSLQSYSILSHLLMNTTWSKKEINVTLIDLMMAAIETTCFAVLWTLYCLAKNPRVQNKLCEEIIQIKKSDGINLDQMHQLNYLKCCVKEALRIYPVVYTTSRIIDKSLTLNEYDIPIKTHVQGSLYAMGRNKNLFDEPEIFVPERWSNENITSTKDKNSDDYFQIDNVNQRNLKCPFSSNNTKTQMNIKKMSKEISSFASLPWGHGARMCIGRRISEVEIYTVISNIIQHYEIETIGKHMEDVDPVLHLVLCPSIKIKLKFTHRK